MHNPLSTPGVEQKQWARLIILARTAKSKSGPGHPSNPAYRKAALARPLPLHCHFRPQCVLRPVTDAWVEELVNVKLTSSIVGSVGIVGDVCMGSSVGSGIIGVVGAVASGAACGADGAICCTEWA